MKKIALLVALFGSAYAYQCSIQNNALIINAQNGVEIIAINKIETASALAIRGELVVTLMSGKKRHFFCANNREIIKEMVKKF